MDFLVYGFFIVVVIGILFIYRFSKKSSKMMSMAMEYAQRYGRIPRAELDKILVEPAFMPWAQEKLKNISPDQVKAQGEARVFGQLFIDYYKQRLPNPFDQEE